MWTRLLFDLSSNPDRLLYQPIQRPNVWAYRFSLGNAPARRYFSFAVERHDYSGELQILKGTLTFEDDLPPPP